MHLYKVTLVRKQTGFSAPITSFVTIAKTVGEAEQVVLKSLIGEIVSINENEITISSPEQIAIVTSVVMLRDHYKFDENDHYVENRNLS